MKNNLKGIKAREKSMEDGDAKARDFLSGQLPSKADVEPWRKERTAWQQEQERLAGDKARRNP